MLFSPIPYVKLYFLLFISQVHSLRHGLPLRRLALPQRHEHHREVLGRRRAVPVIGSAWNVRALANCELLDGLPLKLQRPRPASANTSCPAVCMCHVALRPPAAKMRRPTVKPFGSSVVVFPVKFGAGPSTPNCGAGGFTAAPASDTSASSAVRLRGSCRLLSRDGSEPKYGEHGGKLKIPGHGHDLLRRIIFSETNRRRCAEKDVNRGCCGRRGRSRGTRAVEGAALKDQAAAGVPDFRWADDVPNARSLTQVAGRHPVRRHLERRQRIRAARREQGREGRRRRHRDQRARTCPTAWPSATAPCTWPRSTGSYVSTHRANLRNPPSAGGGQRQFPTDAHHGWKFIRFGPDGRLYVPVGAPCNICETGDPRTPPSSRMKPDGSGRALRPRRAQHGRLRLAPDDQGALVHRQRPRLAGRRPAAGRAEPRARAGLHFGYPYCHGGDIADPEFGGKRAVRRIHAARAGAWPPRRRRWACASTPARMFPADYRNQIFIAEHGSWNRSGTASATASPPRAARAAGPSPTRRSPRAG